MTDQTTVSARARPYPLQDLLRTIGKELDELDAQDAVILETSEGFTVSHEIAGKLEQRSYTHSELAARVEEHRRQCQAKP